MLYIIYSVLFLFIIGIIILFHEFGHYITSKLMGVKVERFGFGLPLLGPVIYKKRLFDTEFVIHLLFFFGGYIVYPESNPKCELPPDSPKKFVNKSITQKSIITLSGIVMNIIFSFLILMMAGLIWHKLPSTQYKVSVEGYRNTQNRNPIQNVIRPNDIIYSVNGKKADNIYAFQEYMRVYYGDAKSDKQQKYLSQNYLDKKSLIYSNDIFSLKKNKPVSIKYIRDGKMFEAQNIETDNNGSLGLILKTDEVFLYNKDIVSLLRNTLIVMKEQVVIIYLYLADFLTGQLNLSDIRGLFSIIKIASDLSIYDNFYKGLWIVSFMSLNMGIVNFLPLPIFDGGRLLLIIFGSRFKKKASRAKLHAILTVVFKILYLLFILILLNDIISIILGIV